MSLFPSFHYVSLTCFPSPCSRHYPAADYYESSVTLGLASRRQSRVPFHGERIDRLRCPTHALTPTRCRLLRASYLLVYSDGYSPGISDRGFSCFPQGKAFLLRTLGFKQSSFHHIGQPLARHLGAATLPHRLFLTCYVHVSVSLDAKSGRLLVLW